MWIGHRIFNPVDKTKLSCNTSHRRSTTVSLETYPFIQEFTSGRVRFNTQYFVRVTFVVNQLIALKFFGGKPVIFSYITIKIHCGVRISALI